MRKIKINFHAHNIIDYRINKALLKVKKKKQQQQAASQIWPLGYIVCEPLV